VPGEETISMIMLDKWDVLEADQRIDQVVVSECKELAFSMCACIFDRLGFDVQSDGTTLIASGRGLRYVFQVRDRGVPMRQFEQSRPRHPVKDGTARKGKAKAHG
jgi:hypothetical protein